MVIPIPMGTALAPAPNDRTYAHPGLVRALAISGIAISLVSILFILALPFLEWSSGVHWILVVSCLVTVLACLYAAVLIARRSNDTIVVTGEGLWCRSPNAPPVFIAWDDVGSVVPQNVMQRLVVTDRSGQRRIHLEFHLERFGELRREVLERSALPPVPGDAAPASAPDANQEVPR